ncbi:Hypothetical predicted protein [Mytilus galloprovincialis]|uniref:Uncharacterized protein n=1 Tax=Mytilus galloprovincialis TaxID=29158 RepID=A0A8B6CN86_MYTGA|nr:Hypothetical predicted protein [Mytilus galloprovincialis]
MKMPNNLLFKVDGEWWTWIDYPKFHQLVKGFNESQKAFSAEDYMAKTPPWAVFGAKEQGFDPVETRFFRKKTERYWRMLIFAYVLYLL